MYRYLLLLLWTKIKDYCHEFVGGKRIVASVSPLQNALVHIN